MAKTNEASAKAESVARPPKPAAGAPTGTQVRRAPGQKEIIPFAWKLVGYSRGVPVTLVKCVERQDAESQMERLRGEGYYRDLAVVTVDTELPRPKEFKRAFSSASKPAKKRPARGKAEGKRPTSKRAGKKTPARKRASAAKASKKKVKKSAAKKSAARKSAARKSAARKSAARKSVGKKSAAKKTTRKKKASAKRKKKTR